MTVYDKIQYCDVITQNTQDSHICVVIQIVYPEWLQMIKNKL